MRIDLAGNFPLSDDGRQRVEQRAEQKLSRFGNTVREATVTIDDVNGPKGGTDVRCLVRARLQHLPDVVIEEKADSIGLRPARPRSSSPRNLASDRQTPIGTPQKCRILPRWRSTCPTSIPLSRKSTLTPHARGPLSTRLNRAWASPAFQPYAGLMKILHTPTSSNTKRTWSPSPLFRSCSFEYRISNKEFRMSKEMPWFHFVIRHSLFGVLRFM